MHNIESEGKVSQAQSSIGVTYTKQKSKKIISSPYNDAQPKIL